MKKVWIVVAIAALTLGLAGCGSVAASQKPMSVQEAGAYYEKVIKPTNDAEDAFNNAYYEGDLTEISPVAKKMAEADKTASDKMESKTWPANAAKYAAAAAKELRAEAHEYASLEDADSLDKVSSDMRNMKWDDSPFEALRKVLGLPAVTDGTTAFTVALGSFNAADGYGSVSITNNLKKPVYNADVAVEVYDAQGKIIDEVYAFCSVIQPGKTGVANYYLDLSGQNASAARVQPTSIIWGRSEGSSAELKAPIQAQPINIK